MEKLSEAQIAALPVTENERKSNEAFAKLASIIKYYNDGWQPSKGDLGYFIYSRRLLLLWVGLANTGGSNCGLDFANSLDAFSISAATLGARLAIKDYDLTQFMIKNYEQEYKDLWMED